MALTAEQLEQVLGRRGRRLHPGAPLRAVPGQELPEAAQARHEALLASLVRALGRTLMERVEQLIASLPARHDDARLDDTGAQRLVRSLLVGFARSVDSDATRAAISRVGRVVDRQNIGQVRRQFEHVIGIVPGEDAGASAAAVQAFVRRNVGLITRMGSEELATVARIVDDARRRGTSQAEVRVQLRERLGIADRRARLIARDQTNKLNSQLTQARQRGIGVRRYIWRTSDDERVREGHRVLDDRTFSWDDPPVVDAATGRRAHPGEDFQCRCTAEPVLEDVIEEAARAGPPEPGPAAVGPRLERQAARPVREQPSEARRYVVDGALVEDAQLRRELDEAALPLTGTEAAGATRRVAELSRALFTPGAGGGTAQRAVHQAELRLQLRRTVQTVLPGLRARDVGRKRPLRHVVAGRRGGRTSTHGFDGKTMLAGTEDFDSTTLGDRLRPIRTLVHEEVHGYSPINPQAYRGAIGVGTEEAVTEMLARRVMRRYEGAALGGRIRLPTGAGIERFAGPLLTNSGGYAGNLRFSGGRWVGVAWHAYDGYIEGVFRAVSIATAREIDDALIDRIERAVARMRIGRRRQISSQAGHFALLKRVLRSEFGLTSEAVSTLDFELRQGLGAGHAMRRS